MYKEITGNLITLAKQGKFDVIAHGCNCFCTMGAGIALQMAKEFNAHLLLLEREPFMGLIDKLGRIDWTWINLKTGDHKRDKTSDHTLAVVNCYTQYGFGKNHKGGKEIPLDYEALTLCLRKINHEFKGYHIGLPQIGCFLAGGDWDRVKDIIKDTLKDMKVTVVIFDQPTVPGVGGAEFKLTLKR